MYPEDRASQQANRDDGKSAAVYWNANGKIEPNKVFPIAELIANTQEMDGKGLPDVESVIREILANSAKQRVPTPGIFGPGQELF